MRCSALETNHRFDGSAASQLAFDLGREPPLLARHIDPKLVMGRRIVATVAGIGEQALDGVADHVLHGGNDACQRGRHRGCPAKRPQGSQTGRPSIDERADAPFPCQCTHNNRRAALPNTLSGRAYEFGVKVSIAIVCIQPSGPREWPLGQPLDTPSAGACCTDTSTTNTLIDPGGAALHLDFIIHQD